MSLLRELQDETRNGSVPVAQALRTALVLAQRLDYEPLAVWARQELDGYPEDAELPAYRAYRSCHVEGEFVGPMGSWERGRPLPRGGVDQKHRHDLFGVEFRQGVAFFQGFVDSATKEEKLQIPWDGSVVAYYQDRFMQMMSLRNAYKVVGLGEVRQLLDAVRTRLLEFALEIERSAPNAGEAAPGEKPVDDAELDQAFNIHIHGDHNVVAAGRKITQTAATASGPEWQRLVAALSDLGLGEPDIRLLREALEADADLPPGSLGPRTLNWYDAIKARLSSGALELTGDATAAVVAGLILDFLGGN